MSRKPLLLAVVSMVFLLLAFAAVDDIANVNETDVVLEYWALGICLGWFASVGIWMLRRRHPRIGGLSLIAALALGSVQFFGASTRAAAAPPVVSAAAFISLAIVVIILFTIDDGIHGATKSL
jgi:hypothetical protein